MKSVGSSISDCELGIADDALNMDKLYLPNAT